MEGNDSPGSRKLSPGSQKWLIAAFIIVLILAGIAFYYYSLYKKNNVISQTPGQTVAVQAQTIVEQVGKLIELPTEQPTIATVSDINKLQGQPFFIHAQNGDKVLLFANANMAILYRPSMNKIIQVGSISIATNNNAINPSVTLAPPATNASAEANTR